MSNNSNFKQYLRIRPLDYQTDMINIKENVITITDPQFKQKENAHLLSSQKEQNFKYDKIFGENTQQEQIYQQIGQPSIDNLLNGNNSLIIAYGQTGSGKTFTIYGENNSFTPQIDNKNKKQGNQKGLVLRCCEYLLQKIKELEQTKEIIVNMSFSDIYFDKIRDLSRAYLNNDQQNLILYENTNGLIMAKDMNFIQLESLNQLQQMLKIAFQLREIQESKGNLIWARAQTILTLNVIQKDKINENIPFKNTIIQFVDLSGSERIAKSLNEGNKLCESILINQYLASLNKCLQNISLKNQNLNYKETKLTHFLQNTMKSRSHISLIGHLNPGDSNFDECLFTLQYLERCSQDAPKMLQLPSNSNGSYNNNNHQNSEQIIKRLKKEVAEQKEKIDRVKNDNKKKLIDIQHLLGIEVDFDELLSKQFTKEFEQLKQQKDSIVMLENVQKYNQNLIKKIEKLHKSVQDIKSQELKKHNEQMVQINLLRDQIKDLQENCQKTQMKNLFKDKQAEQKQLFDKNSGQIEEKVNIVFNLQNFIQNKTQENQKINDIKKGIKYEIEKEHKNQIENLKKEYQVLIDNTKAQFDDLLKQKNEQIQDFIKEIKAYRQNKKQYLNELKQEMLDMYDQIMQYNQVISKIEVSLFIFYFFNLYYFQSGTYTGGIKSFNIAEKEKPILPQRQKYKNDIDLEDILNDEDDDSEQDEQEDQKKYEIKKKQCTLSKFAVQHKDKQNNQDHYLNAELVNIFDFNPNELLGLQEDIIQNENNEQIQENIVLGEMINYGFPKALCAFQNKLLIIGTSYGMIIIFDLKNKKINKIIGCFDDYKKYGPVSSLDICKQGDYIGAGYENGTIVLYDVDQGSVLKSIFGMHEGEIIAFKFLKEGINTISESFDIVGHLCVDSQIIFFATATNIYSGHFFTWKECIKKYVEKSDWKMALKIGFELIKGKCQCFSILPNLNSLEDKGKFMDIFLDLVTVFLQNSSEEITQQGFSYEIQKENKDKGKKYIYQCMWFLRTTLEGKMFPNDQIEEKVYINTIRSLVVWLFIEEILIAFLNYDSKIFLDILFMFFEGRPALILREYDQNLYQIKQLLEVADDSEFDEIVAYLYFLQGDIERSFNMYLFMKKDQIFEILSQFPSLLLDYVECIIQDRKQGLIALKNETLALYITLLCQQEPSRVIQELKNNYYPLEEILIICEKNKATEAEGFICEKLGYYQKALELYSEVFLNICRKAINKISQEKYFRIMVKNVLFYFRLQYREFYMEKIELNLIIDKNELLRQQNTFQKQIQIQQIKAEIKDKMIRKLKIFDCFIEENIMDIDQMRQKYIQL
ncbi:kinesin motor domain protein [Ichthyophthirius multifiliis]|uniref:Kinesin motor domain protein n=1 Tax=Ichthyophthirius multifiliis TaxID=5932 RepID=G0QV73_ICHMU|nr:kinesin motor domain protein [Ichthyophthirius multifiliis]EGR30886.1 kinesin motor domain protein [Ichthyophthirius multifiliis]|eukprot:XP_004032473.1 kinesin motor domain protein [Ichthyophthirius multifiliis]